VVTLPLQRWATSSTELASALQIVQVGAQNHSITACPAKDAPSSRPPPRIGALNDRLGGTAPVDVTSFDELVGVAAGDALSAPLQAVAPTSTASARRA